jgi:uncharacterized membrane protein YbaN (DUF454 family)
MTLATKRKVYMILGWAFVVFGVLGLFLPILQGVLFLAVGLVLLAKAQPRFRLLKQRLKKRYPKYGAMFDKAEERAAELARGEFFRNNRRRGD